MKSILDIVRKGLLSLIFIVLFTPFCISKFTNNDFFPLKGSFNLPLDTIFSKEKWISGEYQQKKEEYLNASFGLRNLFVRTNNQIVYSLFSRAKANGVIVGKDNYLYEEAYINAFYGKDFLGEDSLSRTINRLKFISDTLNQLGKQLILIFAPGKASFYPEYIPESYLPQNTKTNYKVLSERAFAAGLNMIDFNKWFLSKKQSSEFPLYPKYGIHWSVYGTALAADSLVKKIDFLRQTISPRIKITKVQMAPPYDSDYDIADGMNLLFKCRGFDMAYPQTTIDNSNAKSKHRVLVISDSFYWGLFNLGISNCFQNDHFWYYNKQVYPESSKQELLTDQLDIKDEINKHDVVVIMATEATLPRIGWGFIEKTEKLYRGVVDKKEYSSEYYKKVKEMITYIKSDSKWLNDAVIRAKAKKISLDSNLVLEAMWQLNNQNK